MLLVNSIELQTYTRLALTRTSHSGLEYITTNENCCVSLFVALFALGSIEAFINGIMRLEIICPFFAPFIGHKKE